MVCDHYAWRFSSFWMHACSLVYMVARIPHLFEEKVSIGVAAGAIYLSSLFFICHISCDYKEVINRGRVESFAKFDVAAVFHSWGVLGMTGWLVMIHNVDAKGHHTLAYHLSYAMSVFFYILFILIRLAPDPNRVVIPDEEEDGDMEEEEPRPDHSIKEVTEPGMDQVRLVLLSWCLFRAVGMVAGLEEIRDGSGWALDIWTTYWYAEMGLYAITMIFFSLRGLPSNRLLISTILYLTTITGSDMYFVLQGHQNDTGSDYATFVAYTGTILIGGSILSLDSRPVHRYLTSMARAPTSDEAHRNALVTVGAVVTFRFAGWVMALIEIKDHGSVSTGRWTGYWIAELVVVLFAIVCGVAFHVHVNSAYFQAYVVYLILVLFADGYVVLGGSSFSVTREAGKSYATYMTYTSSLTIAASLPLWMHGWLVFDGIE